MLTTSRLIKTCLVKDLKTGVFDYIYDAKFDFISDITSRLFSNMAKIRTLSMANLVFTCKSQTKECQNTILRSNIQWRFLSLRMKNVWLRAQVLQFSLYCYHE